MDKAYKFDLADVEAKFRKMPSCKDDVIDISEYEQFLKDIGYNCSQDAFEQYKKFWMELFKGKVALDLLRPVLAVAKEATKVVPAVINYCDANKDGFIQADEFKVILDVMQVHDPGFEKIDFAKFTEEADTNKDGKISIDEAVDWFSKKFKATH